MCVYVVCVSCVRVCACVLCARDVCLWLLWRVCCLCAGPYSRSHSRSCALKCLWSPRLVAWIVTLAPSGREGIFIAISQMKDLLLDYPVMRTHIQRRHFMSEDAALTREIVYCSPTMSGAGLTIPTCPTAANVETVHPQKDQS